ncbi:MAG TPA: amino acid ABC transporter permease, partial [Pseudolysinimonas sp.]
MTMEGPALSSLELERRAFRRRQSTRSVLIGALSTLVFAVVAWLLIVNAPGWDRVQKSFFDPEVALAALPRVFEGFLL